MRSFLSGRVAQYFVKILFFFFSFFSFFFFFLGGGGTGKLLQAHMPPGGESQPG